MIVVMGSMGTSLCINPSMRTRTWSKSDILIDQTILNPVLRLVRRSPWEVMKTRTDSTSRSFKIKKKKRTVEFLFRHLEHLDNNQFCFQQYFNTFHDDSLAKSWLSHLVLWALVRWKQTNKQIMPTSFTHIKIHPGGIPK